MSISIQPGLLRVLQQYRLCLLVLTLTIPQIVDAQLPECNSGLIYYNTGIGAVNGQQLIYNYDPNQPVSATNPSLNTITLLAGAEGLAVSENLSGQGPSPTFYTVFANYYFYYDGTTWVNTGHWAGPYGYGIAAGGGYIYNVNGLTGTISKYNGTSNATMLPLTIAANWGGLSIGPSDLGADCHGNFYVLFDSLFRKYDPSGNLVQTWTCPTDGFLIGGYTVMNDRLYWPWGYAELDPLSPTLNFQPMSISSIYCGDMASCPGGILGNLQTEPDTGYYCGYGPGVTVKVIPADSSMSAHWQIVSGEGLLLKTDSSVTVTTDSIVNIAVSAAGCYCPDTFTVVNATPIIDATQSSIITGCKGLYEDTLHGFVSGVPGLNYSYSWSPSSVMVSGGNTLSPVVQVGSNVSIILSVNTSAGEGGCLWQDTGQIKVADSSVIATFDIETKFGCSTDDTVICLNSSSKAMSYAWNFDDGGISHEIQPIHIYKYRDSFNITLIASNTVCSDTAIKSVNTERDRVGPVDLGPDLSFCDDKPIYFNLGIDVPLGALATWSNGSQLSNMLIRDTGIYWVALSKYNCTFSDTILILPEKCRCQIIVPSAFTPNGDGRNDVFRAVTEPGCLIRGYILTVYNRWGQPIYIGYDPKQGWDGSFSSAPADVGTYMYSLQLEAGTSNEILHFKGDITLIR